MTGPTGCPETPVRNYNYTLRYIPEERRSHLLFGGSLKSFTVWLVTTLYQLKRGLKRDGEKAVVSYSGCNPVFRLQGRKNYRLRHPTTGRFVAG